MSGAIRSLQPHACPSNRQTRKRTMPNGLSTCRPQTGEKGEVSTRRLRGRPYSSFGPREGRERTVGRYADARTLTAQNSASVPQLVIHHRLAQHRPFAPARRAAWGDIGSRSRLPDIFDPPPKPADRGVTSASRAGSARDKESARSHWLPVINRIW